MEKIIQVEDIHRKFKTYQNRTSGNFIQKMFRENYYNTALDGVSFSVNEGDIVALLGRNGSGKSTLVKILTGILRPDKGTVRVMGLDPWEDRTKLAMHIGVVLGAHTQLFWNLPALDTFTFMKSIYHIPERDFTRRLDYLVDELDLKKVYRRQVRQLSLGEQMKCNFVASVLHNPKMIFLDEPTIGVDLPSKTALRKAMTYIRDEYKATFLITTHIVEDITVAEKIILLDKGKIVFDDSRERLEQMFGNKRQIDLHLREDTKFNSAKYGKLIGRSSDHVRLEIEQRTLKTKSFISLLASDAVLDYKVTEPGLNYILTKLYKNLDTRKRKKGSYV